MWNHPGAQCQVILGHTGRSISEALHSDLEDNDAAAQDVATTGSTGPDDAARGRINSMLVLDALGNQDSLGLRRSLWYLGSIDIFDDGHGIFFVEYKYMRDHTYGMRLRRILNAFDRGRKLLWAPQTPVTSLMDLPRPALRSIWRHTTSTPTGITVDLNTHTVQSLDRNPFQVFHAFQGTGLHDAV